MTFEIALVLAILLGALVLFALEVFSADFVAFAVMALLMVLGLVTPQQGISGFGNSATVTVMAMFVLSAGLYRTGAIDLAARKLARLGGRSELRQLLLVVLTVGPISAFLNNTAAVAILIPFALRLARQAGRSPSKLLIPLSYASQLAGVITLVGTSTNLLASALAEELGLGAFGMFEFSAIGLVVFAAGTAYLLSVGRWLLPERAVAAEPAERFRLKHYLSEIQLEAGSPLAGRTLAELKLTRLADLEVLEVVRGGQHLPTPLAERALAPGDVLIVRASAEGLDQLQRAHGLSAQPQRHPSLAAARGEDMVFCEAIVAPGSPLLGATLRELDFRNRHGASVLALNRHGQAVGGRLADTPLSVGDALLLKAPARVVQALHADPGLILTGEAGVPAPRVEKVPVAVAIVAGVVAVAALEALPIVVAALAGAALMVVCGCLRVRELHQSIRWDVVFLLAGVLPLGIALRNTGADQLLAGAIAGAAEVLPPLAVLALFYLATTLLTEVISNNAAVVLLTPLAAGTALSLGLDPKAFVLAVMLAASTSFMTPVGYQTNAMVLGPGGYRFGDYFRVGAPLNALIWVVTTLAIAWLWGI